VLTTAGNLVFQGRSDGRFAAYTADEGKLVWEFPAHVGIIAPPVAYAVDGEQYVSVVAGWGGAFALASGVPRHKDNVLTEGRLLTFKLGATAQLPEPRVAYLELPEPPEMEITPQQVATGETLYHTYCAVCHGPGAVSSGGGTPDLRYSAADVHDTWDAIVLQGAFSGRGMTGFDHVLSADEARAVQAYVVSQARASIELCNSEYRESYPEVVGTACVRAQAAAAR
jgi:quinohemoprotein ethanol dehydrogenase